MLSLLECVLSAMPKSTSTSIELSIRQGWQPSPNAPIRHHAVIYSLDLSMETCGFNVLYGMRHCHVHCCNVSSCTVGVMHGLFVGVTAGRGEMHGHDMTLDLKVIGRLTNTMPAISKKT